VREVSIVGIGQVPVEEHWELSLRDLGTQAVLSALSDAQIETPQAIYVGNMLSGQLSNQQNLGAMIADYAGFRGIPAIKIEAACASAAAALHMAYLTVAGGMNDIVVACGVEKMTEGSSDEMTWRLTSAADAVYEAEHGISFVALNALLMRRYMHEYGIERHAFAGFAVNAHQNAVNNPNAMFRRAITETHYDQARMVADPVTLYDSAGVADGAAAVVLVPTEMAQALELESVRIVGSAIGTDSVAIHARRDPLFLEAAALSSSRAYAQAGLGPSDIDFFELHDAFTIMAALSLEATGMAKRGQGVRLAQEGAITLSGRLPISTMGGLKARGHPVGATGLYQVVEATQQLRGEAGANQLQGCRVGMTQNIGGSGATVVTHILAR